MKQSNGLRTSSANIGRLKNWEIRLKHANNNVFIAVF
ncbi:hypothetical protein PEDI_37360 [Persicobacter diffluens]|uniref:Uncharacterized protein n=1 Tax=Persicobacter diffluens TaxID=981 RepID=A0AAN4W1J7_9BACT|nr:hypothetical protein PEDI_37360 [Persicobacter diffluens]